MRPRYALLLLSLLLLCGCYRKEQSVDEMKMGNYNLFAGVHYDGLIDNGYVWSKCDFDIPINLVDSIQRVRKIELDSAYSICIKYDIKP